MLVPYTTLRRYAHSTVGGLDVFLLWAGWRQPTEHDIPRAVEIVPPAEWREWWTDLLREFADAGLPVTATAKDFDRVSWYTAADIPIRLLTYTRPLNHASPYTAKGLCIQGIWLMKDNSITLIDSVQNDRTTIRHEMTHAIRQFGGHEVEWFDPRFDNYTGIQSG